MAITVAEVTSAIEAFGKIDLVSLKNLNLESLHDDTLLASDVMAIIAPLWPPAALLAVALKVAYEAEPFLDLHISPDPDPIHDAQLTPTRGGRNP